MRAILLGLALAAATASAAAQPAGPVNPFEFDELRARQQAAERRAIDQANQLMALEARLRAEQADRDLRLGRQPLWPPTQPYDPAVPSLLSAEAAYPSVPDAALADSNRRVREAAANRR